MFSKTSPRILRTIGSGLVVMSVGVGLISGGVAYAQPASSNTTSCAGPLGNRLPGDSIPREPEGTVRNTGGKKEICVNGKWLQCRDELVACKVGIIGGSGITNISPVSPTSILAR